jgi:hypothetical protein
LKLARSNLITSQNAVARLLVTVDGSSISRLWTGLGICVFGYAKTVDDVV